MVPPAHRAVVNALQLFENINTCEEITSQKNKKIKQQQQQTKTNQKKQKTHDIETIMVAHMQCMRTYIHLQTDLHSTYNKQTHSTYTYTRTHIKDNQTFIR